MSPYQVIDLDGDLHGVDTEEEAHNLAQGFIEDALSGGEWAEEVEGVAILQLIVRAQKVDVVPCDCGDHDYHCGYALLPDNQYLGQEPGDDCNREGCPGILQLEDVRDCTCHINPPCAGHSEDRAWCPECNWRASDDYPEEAEAAAVSAFLSAAQACADPMAGASELEALRLAWEALPVGVRRDPMGFTRWGSPA